MKITREKVQQLIQKRKRGVSWDAICRAFRADSPVRRESVSRILKLLTDDGLVVKKRGLYLDSALAPQISNKQKGRTESPAFDFERIAKKYRLPLHFDDAVLREADRVSRGEKREIESRRKVDEWAITIDSESAKDLDDAVSVRKDGMGYELGIHIADVSWYVRKGSLLDQEALSRGTSVYLVDKVIPMFPPQLSNDLCSLNADRPKLCFSAFLSVDRKGNVRQARFERTTLRVNRRFSYKEVEAILKGKKDPDRKKLQMMDKLAGLLRKQRTAAGSLLFEVPEIKIELDRQGVPVSVVVPERLKSEGIVEEFMLAANQQVASFLAEKGASIFRIHEDPDRDKLAAFFDFAGRMGVSLKQPKTMSSLGMQHILDTIRTNPAAGVLNSMLIRSMQKAVYSTDNPGHFGLAFTMYTHFTSPIRRYPDLIVHRLLAETLGGSKAYNRKRLQDIAVKATEREQVALEAEREILRVKGARYLEQFIGKTVQGRVTSVTVFGAFLTLIPFGIDGMLHVSQMGRDRWNLDPYGHSLVTGSGKRLSIGDSVGVRILRVDPLKGFVDLTMEG